MEEMGVFLRLNFLSLLMEQWLVFSPPPQQGHPLSSFLCTLVADAFDPPLEKGREGSLFEGFDIGSNNLEVSYLQYAHDTYLFLDANFMFPGM